MGAKQSTLLLLAVFLAGGGAAAQTSAFRVDPTFGEGGAADISWRLPQGSETISSVVTLGSGQIAVIGTTYTNDSCGFISRLNPDGRMDAAFASGGRFLLDPSYGPLIALDAKLDAQGRIISLWSMSRDYNPSPGASALVLRHLPDGTPDPTFGTPSSDPGISTCIVPGIGSRWTDMQLAGDGSILILASAVDQQLKLVRVSADGRTISSLISTYGGKPVVGMQVKGEHIVLPVALSDQVGFTGLGIKRLTLDGMIDGTFGAGGTASLSPRTGVGLSLTEQASVRFSTGGSIALVDDRLVVCWVTPRRNLPGYSGIQRVAVVARFGPDGELDASFGVDGTVEAVLPGPLPVENRPISLLAISANGPFCISDSGPQMFSLSSEGTVAEVNLPIEGYSLVHLPRRPWFDGATGTIARFWSVSANPQSTEGTSAHLHRLNLDFSPPEGSLPGSGTTSKGVTFETGSAFSPVPIVEAMQDRSTWVVLDNLLGGGSRLAEDGVTYLGPGNSTRILRLRGDGSPDPAWGRNGHQDIDEGVALDIEPTADGGLACLWQDGRLLGLSANGETAFDTALPKQTDGVTHYLRVMSLPDGSVVCTGVHYTTKNRYLLAYRVKTDGEIDPGYGGRIMQIRSILNEQPPRWWITSHAVLPGGKIRLFGQSSPDWQEILPRVPKPRFSNSFVQLTQLDASGRADRTFGKGGVAHVPGLVVRWPAYMTQPDANGKSYVAATYYDGKLRRSRELMLGYDKLGRVAPLFGKPSVDAQQARTLTLLADGTLGRLDFDRSRMDFFDSVGRSRLGPVGFAQIDSPEDLNDQSTVVTVTGDLLVQGFKTLYRLTRGGL